MKSLFSGRKAGPEGAAEIEPNLSSPLGKQGGLL